MPMGPAPLGLVYFVGVKFVGYTAAAYGIRKAYPESTSGVAKVGAARTAIGVGTGLAYGALWMFLSSKVFHTQDSGVAFLLGLLPVRIAEWLLLLHLFFDRGLRNRLKSFKGAMAGTVWSYCLDAVGIAAAFVIPGGFWVC
ncbi:MAG TPA: hypothetical protein VHE23_07275 [Candidatus Acidoferrales bacterium]|nr:hypothetical protein [Candidatus Acidoferrales bacterium]